jgi:hypothetical protein
MLTTAGSAGFSTEENPFVNYLTDRQRALAVGTVAGAAPTTAWLGQCFSDDARSPSPISAARRITVAAHRRI